MPVRRGQCPACRFRFRLRKDGTVQRHSLYSGTEAHECEGSGKQPRPFNPEECGECMVHFGANPFLVEACASVGIECGKSTQQLLQEYLADFHARGHEAA